MALVGSMRADRLDVMEDIDPEAPYCGSGKWKDPGVPHKGWVLKTVIDVGPDDWDKQLCEMCEARMIRYVHFVSHRDYPDTLEVGCVCSCNMTNDYVTPREREADLRRKTKRRQSATAVLNRAVRKFVSFIDRF